MKISIDEQEIHTTRDIGLRTRLNVFPLKCESKSNLPSRKSSIQMDALAQTQRIYQFQNFRIISQSNTKENSDWFSLTKRRNYISQSQAKQCEQTRQCDLIEEKVKLLKQKLNKGFFDIKIGGQRIKPLNKKLDIPITTIFKTHNNNLNLKTETVYWQNVKITQDNEIKSQNNKIYKLPSFRPYKQISVSKEPSQSKPINLSRKEYSKAYRNQNLCGWIDDNQNDYYQYSEFQIYD